MVVPHTKDGYTLFSIDTSHMSTYTSKLLFQHKTKQFHHLFNRLCLASEELRLMVEKIKDISQSFYSKFKGRIITFMLKVFTVYSANPLHYGHHGDYVVAANYTKLRYYMQKIVKSLITSYGYPDKYYRFHIPKAKLFKISELFADSMIPLTNGLVPKYRRLIASQ